MAFKSSGKRVFRFMTILISAFPATLRAQSSGDIGTALLSSSIPSLSLCGESADECAPSPTADQNGSNQNNNTSGSSSHDQNDWVHSWMRKVAKARASQPHYVSPIVTANVLLVQQYRYDMSRQQDPTGGTITATY